MAEKKPSQPKERVVISGNNIRMESPKGRSKPKSKVTVVAPVATAPVSGFVSFLREHAIVGLAVGIVIGTQVKALVDQLIKSFVDPFLGVVIRGAGNLSSKTTVYHYGDGKTALFTWGAFLYTLIDFIAVLATIYALIKIFNLDKLDKKKE